VRFLLFQTKQLNTIILFYKKQGKLAHTSPSKPKGTLK
jgi:hypothetical protein